LAVPPPSSEEGRTVTEILGDSAAVGAVRFDIERLAPSDLSVLVQGPTGVGKDLVARAVHRLSRRRGSYVPVNCAGIPVHLAESVLFGHERGAFTGASAKSDGVFVQADRGTLFLDEVGELPLAIQAKLLRVLEDGQVTPVGASRATQVNVRIVAATHVELGRAVAAGKFREDLLSRLREWPVAVPPLASRRRDIPLLLKHFSAGSHLDVTPDALEALLVWRWPDNIRGVRTLARRMQVLLPEGGTLELELLPEHIQAVPELPPEVKRPRLNEETIRRALESMQGNISATAELLGYSRKHLYSRINALDIDASEYRQR
jgi:DNA-binding NtrC family response regulator